MRPMLWRTVICAAFTANGMKISEWKRMRPVSKLSLALHTTLSICLLCILLTSPFRLNFLLIVLKAVSLTYIVWTALCLLRPRSSWTKKATGNILLNLFFIGSGAALYLINRSPLFAMVFSSFEKMYQMLIGKYPWQFIFFTFAWIILCLALLKKRVDFLKGAIFLVVGWVFGGFFLLMIQYYYGMGSTNFMDLLEEDGIEVIAATEAVNKKYKLNIRPELAISHSRKIAYDHDTDSLFLSAGPTFNWGGHIDYQALTKIPLSHPEDLKTIRAPTIKSFHSRREFPWVLAGIWTTWEIMTVDKKTWQPLRRFKLPDLRDDTWIEEIVEVILNEDGNEIFVLYDTIPAVVRYDIKNEPRLIAKRDLLADGLVPLGTSGIKLLTNREMSRYYFCTLSIQYEDPALFVLEGKSLEILQQTALPGTNAGGVALEEASQSLFLTYIDRPVLEVRNAGTLEVEKVFRADPGSRWIELDSRRELIYLINSDRGRLDVIHRNTGESVEKLSIGNKPWSAAMGPDNRYLYLFSKFGVLRLDLERYDRMIAQ